MTLVRRIARPMLAAIFVYGGIDALRHPDAKVAVAGDVPQKLASLLPVNLPSKPEDLVRIDAAVKVGGGLALATGRAPRLASLALIASMVPTTYAGHDFWAKQDAAEKARHRTQFFKNLGLIGGLMLAAVDTEGKPSVAWRTRHAAAETKKETKRAVRKAQKAQDRAAKKAQKVQARAAKKLPG